MQIRLGRTEIEEAVEHWTFDRLLGPWKITDITIGTGGQHITVEVEADPDPDDPADVIPDPMRPEVTD
jgi:hypothetical protein